MTQKVNNQKHKNVAFVSCKGLTRKKNKERRTECKKRTKPNKEK
jgi:hypothetical protein